MNANTEAAVRTTTELLQGGAIMLGTRSPGGC